MTFSSGLQALEKSLGWPRTWLPPHTAPMCKLFLCLGDTAHPRVLPEVLLHTSLLSPSHLSLTAAVLALPFSPPLRCSRSGGSSKPMQARGPVILRGLCHSLSLPSGSQGRSLSLHGLSCPLCEAEGQWGRGGPGATAPPAVPRGSAQSVDLPGCLHGDTGNPQGHHAHAQDVEHAAGHHCTPARLAHLLIRST